MQDQMCLSLVMCLVNEPLMEVSLKDMTWSQPRIWTSTICRTCCFDRIVYGLAEYNPAHTSRTSILESGCASMGGNTELILADTKTVSDMTRYCTKNIGKKVNQARPAFICSLFNSAENNPSVVRNVKTSILANLGNRCVTESPSLAISTWIHDHGHVWANVA